MNKITLHIPVEQYGFIAIEMEGCLEDAINEYKAAQRVWKVGGGLPDPQWRAVLDEYLSTGKITNGGDIYGDLSERQRDIINECKKSLKRTNKE